MNDLSSLPSVDYLLQTRQAAELVARYGRSLTLEAIHSTLDDIREGYRDGNTVIQRSGILTLVQNRLEDWEKPTLIPVINATGVVLHTNLGRAPISRTALKAMHNVSSGYTNLEYDLETGKRGSRSVHTEKMLTLLTGAEAAIVVNNNAAAILLVLTALAKRHKVVISRTQLVEIGGGFRIPDVMKQSGAHLVEVGSTNRVYISDYEEALKEGATLLVRAHHSNYRIIGFTNEPSLAELATLAAQNQVVLVDDLGSGALIDTARFGLAHEPTVQESVSAGCDLVCFSGDKLLGGPQAGIIVGKRELVERLKQHPLARALRADKLCLAGLSATLTHYLKDEAEREIPIWQMIAKTPEQIQTRARHWKEIVGKGKVMPGFSTVGGGSLPEETLKTYLLALEVPQPNRFLGILRKMHPPVIARIENDKIVLDPRTVLNDQEGALLVGVQNALSRKN
jgi:L-seryl-tRNA(Ser) seleniumtransferase